MQRSIESLEEPFGQSAHTYPLNGLVRFKFDEPLVESIKEINSLSFKLEHDLLREQGAFVQ